jgi:hypothetical protein
MKQVRSIHEGQQLCHLSWNPSGSACELVVVDVLGRISILNIGSAINKLVVTRVPTRDQEDDLNAIAGMVWLNVDRQVSFLPLSLSLLYHIPTYAILLTLPATLVSVVSFGRAEREPLPVQPLSVSAAGALPPAEAPRFLLYHAFWDAQVNIPAGRWTLGGL